MKLNKDLNYFRKNAEEDYIKTPISVLRYITELESTKSTVKQLIYYSILHFLAGITITYLLLN
jgi:hypothetical protein